MRLSRGLGDHLLVLGLGNHFACPVPTLALASLDKQVLTLRPHYVNNIQLLDETEENIVIYQWRADQLFVDAEGRGK